MDTICAANAAASTFACSLIQKDLGAREVLLSFCCAQRAPEDRIQSYARSRRHSSGPRTAVIQELARRTECPEEANELPRLCSTLHLRHVGMAMHGGSMRGCQCLTAASADESPTSRQVHQSCQLREEQRRGEERRGEERKGEERREGKVRERKGREEKSCELCADWQVLQL